MKLVFLLLGIIVPSTLLSQVFKSDVRIEKIELDYQGKTVKGRKLTVSTEIPMSMHKIWTHVKTPALLQFVAKGIIKFKPTDSELPKQWEEGKTYGVEMRIFGFIPFGGTHFLFIEKVDDTNFIIATKEWDNSAKIWNHTITLKDLKNGKTYYEDSILIYGGKMTGLITSFAKRFYIHRQQRWRLIARENLNFLK